jgi:hypothetical protein
MAQHTPGPWGLSESGQIINPAATGLWDRFISVTLGVSTPSPATAESNANRDLIVQAPAMLAALNEVMGYLGDDPEHPDACATNPPEISGADALGPCDCYVGQVTAVIAAVGS